MDWRIYMAGLLGLIAAFAGLYLLWSAASTRPSAGGPAGASVSQLQNPRLAGTASLVPPRFEEVRTGIPRHRRII